MPHNDLKTTAVTVSYGNRANYLKKVIEASFTSGVSDIVVVDNGLFPESRTKLEALCSRYGSSLHVLTHNRNLGSAGGFKSGLVFAHQQTKTDYLWLLDDDNVPEPEALQELHRAYTQLNVYSHGLLALLSLRPVGRKHFQMLSHGVPPDSVFPRRSSFRHVHIANLLDRRRDKVTREDSSSNFYTHDPIPIPYASYGGLFFQTELLEKIGYPDETFYLYADDREFSYRITHQGGHIFLVPTSLINDIHMSDHHSNTHEKPYLYLLNGDPHFFKTYYFVRNNAYFQYRFWTDSNFTYTLNKYLFFIQLLRYALQFNKLKRFRDIWKAVQEGEQGFLGYRQTANTLDRII